MSDPVAVRESPNRRGRCLRGRAAQAGHQQAGQAAAGPAGGPGEAACRALGAGHASPHPRVGLPQTLHRPGALPGSPGDEGVVAETALFLGFQLSPWRGPRPAGSCVHPVL